MTKREYLEALSAVMAGLPEEEVHRTAEYYDELISDAMEAGETEEQAVASLPAPEEAAYDQRPRPFSNGRRRRKEVPSWIWVLCGAALCAVIVLCVLPLLNIHPGQVSTVTSDTGGTKQQNGITQLISKATDLRMTATTQTYSPEEVKSIDIHSPVFSLELIAEQRQDIELTYYDREGWRCAVTLKNGKLEVKYPAYRQDLKDFTNKKDYTVTMRVPLDYTAEYEVDANMADISASGCTGNMELTANMGSIEVSDCTGDLNIKADMGDISVSGCKADKLDLNCSMGSITLEDTSGTNLDLSCNMGAVDLEDIDYRDLTLEADAGSIEGTLAGAQSDYSVTCKVGMGASNVRSGGDGVRTLKIECDMGDVSLDFSD